MNDHKRDPADGIADVIRDMATRLEERTAEAVEYRTRLELTELAQSSVESERDRLREDLARERERAHRAERRLEELEAPPEPQEATVTDSEGANGGAPSEPEKRSWWRRLFDSG